MEDRERGGAGAEKKEEQGTGRSRDRQRGGAGLGEEQGQGRRRIRERGGAGTGENEEQGQGRRRSRGEGGSGKGEEQEQGRMRSRGRGERGAGEGQGCDRVAGEEGQHVTGAAEWTFFTDKYPSQALDRTGGERESCTGPPARRAGRRAAYRPGHPGGLRCLRGTGTPEGREQL
jgi:hypothetical protein